MTTLTGVYQKGRDRMTLVKRTRIRIMDEPDPDFSWLDEDCFKDEDPNNHVALLMVVETECECCGSWTWSASLSNIDMLAPNAITGVFDSPDEIHDNYLRNTAQELLAEAQA